MITCIVERLKQEGQTIPRLVGGTGLRWGRQRQVIG
jgi:hypothetical protein